MNYVPLLKTQWCSLLVLCAIAVLSVGWSLNAKAAEDTSDRQNNIAISPATQRLQVKAGETVTEELTVINNGPTSTKFIVYSRPYSVTNEQYDLQFKKTSEHTDLYQWVQFEQTSYTLAPGERIDVPYTVSVPATAAPGGHYGVIFVETQPPADASESVMRKKRVGNLVMANVEGDVIRQGELVSSQIDFWQTTPPLTASFRVKNTGNTDFQAELTTVITDMFGSIKHQEVKDYIVYPDTIRDITFEWKQAAWFGLFRVEQTMTVLDDTTKTSQLVLMLPRWLLVTVIALIIIGAGYGLLRRKRR